MKRNFFSLFLIIAILFSLGINVFAEESHTTDITYIGEGTEWYKLTVPAELVPGETDTVVLEGTWASDRTVIVTADETVDLSNNLNNNIKTLDIEFNSIQQPGDNYNEIYVTEEISVANIEGALFGNWSGTFYYNVDVKDKIITIDSGEPGLYDANGVMLCSWEDSGIDVEQDYLPSECMNVTTSGSYVITNNYPDTTQLVLPNGIVSIGNYVFNFYSGSGLTSVVIPNSVTRIGNSAFGHNSNLTSINIPDSVTYIGESAFYGTGISSIVIPDSVTNIGGNAFATCTSLTSVTIPDSITFISNTILQDCSGLTSVTFGNSVTSIGLRAFHNCINLATINYMGSETQWNSITKRTEWDLNAGSNIEGGYKIVYNYSPLETVYADTFADNSWEEIIDAVQNDAVPSTWNVGDTKPMTINGADYNVQIIGKDHDTYTSGGTAPLTFQLVELYGEKAKMNSDNTNSTGWSGSAMRTTTLPTILSNMPSEVQSAIKAVDKQTLNGARSGLETTSDKLFLLSEIEVLGSTTYSKGYSEGSRYEFYSNGGSIIKNFNGSADYWWLRGPNYKYSSIFSGVSDNGNLYDNYADDNYCVSFGFCF